MDTFSIENIVADFKQMSEADYADFIIRDGVRNKIVLGVRMGKIHDYAKHFILDLCSDNDLAYNFIKSLCTSDIRELQQLGASILKRLELNAFGNKLNRLIDEIVPSIKNWEFCDTLASVVAAEIPYSKMLEYVHNDEWSARFGLVCAIFAYKKGFPRKSSIRILDESVRRNSKPTPQLKKAIKWAKREFGKCLE
ncbi:DNA alkylation repair protein [bacterium]|nr:DNA alkylation repair protein [bacterium]